MPELPEVETVRSGLERLIVGKTISSVEFDWQKSFPNDPAIVNNFLLNSTVKSVKRRAKVLIIELLNNYSLMIHLRMTGQLVYVGTLDLSINSRHSESDPSVKKSSLSSVSISDDMVKEEKKILADRNDSDGSGIILESSEERFGAGHPNDSLIAKLPDKSTRVTLQFSDSSFLYFNDQRKFGWMKLVASELVADDPFMQKVGPEPLEPEFSDLIFSERVKKRSNTSIKAAILDQTVLAGVGNIYADESLWGASIHPATLVKNLSFEQLSKLKQEIVFVLALSIEKGGSTDRNYVNAEGKRGSYIDFARVFRKEGLPCPRCSSVIIKTRVAGRGTHICEVCQIKIV